MSNKIEIGEKTIYCDSEIADVSGEIEHLTFRERRTVMNSSIDGDTAVEHEYFVEVGSIQERVAKEAVESLAESLGFDLVRKD